MNSNENELESIKKDLALSLFNNQMIKFGLFTLKSGLQSPFYIDLRLLVSYPELLKKTAVALTKLSDKLEFKRVAALPYAAIAIATAFSLETGKPMIYPRKETKNYGTKKAIEGLYFQGDKTLILDDLITTGESKFEAIKILTDAGLKINDVLVLIDRQQGGKEKLKEKNLNLHSFFTVTELFKILKENNKLSEEKFNELIKYLENEKVK